MENLVLPSLKLVSFSVSVLFITSIVSKVDYIVYGKQLIYKVPTLMENLENWGRIKDFEVLVT